MPPAGIFGLGLGVAAIAPLVRNPWKGGPNAALWHHRLGARCTARRSTLRSTPATPHEITLVRPEDQGAGSMQTVFPFRESERGDERGAAAAALTPRRQPRHADPVAPRHRGRSRRRGTENYHYGDYYAYSKICTHLGCPASLYEAQTNRILCPCHQSQFIATEYARPVFGPAARPLPQLPITVNDEGYLVATGDFNEPVGPAFWELGAIMSAITTPTSAGGGLAAKVGEALDELDQRFHPAAGLRKQFNKVFPTHWSFMLGEVALYSFIVLLLSGTYLGAVLRPVDDRGRLRRAVRQPARRRTCPARTRARCDISFEVRGGLFVRQVHHWAALLFVAAMVAHMFRTFFTGAFRKPRETNWVIGVLLIFIGTFEGFTGYSLPDDLLSGIGLRIASGITLSVPVIGTWTQWALFGGEFPGTEIIPRLYIVHVLLLPGVLLALIGVHVGLVWYQKHTQFPGPGRTEKQRRRRADPPGVRGQGRRLLRRHASASSAMMGGLFQINPIWNFGPYNPAHDLRRLPARLLHAGSARAWPGMFPPWEIVLGQLHASRRRSGPRPAFLPLLFVRRRRIYPAIERQDARRTTRCTTCCSARGTCPVRTSLGVMAIAFYVVLLVLCAQQRLDRVLLRHLAQRHHLGGPDRAAGRSADRLLRDLPDLPRPAALRPGGARARHRDRHHQAAAARRVHRGAPAAGAVSTTTATPSRWSTRALRCPKRMNQLGMGGAPVPGSLLTPDPPDGDGGAGAGPGRRSRCRGGRGRTAQRQQQRSRREPSAQRGAQGPDGLARLGAARVRLRRTGLGATERTAPTRGGPRRSIGGALPSFRGPAWSAAGEDRTGR